MLDLTYVGEKTKNKIKFKKISEHIVCVKGNLKAKTKGFTLSREGKEDDWDYKDFTTIYREFDGEIQFSNDGSVWVKPIPIANFYTNGGGNLEGETMQEVCTYEELVVPMPIADENYEFTKWEPEIPESGDIDENKSFTAIFVSTLPPPEPAPTLEERIEVMEVTVDSILTDVIPSLM